MKNAKRALLILLSVVLLFVTLNWYIKGREDKEILKQEQELANHYTLQNNAFFITGRYVYNTSNDPESTQYYPLKETKLKPLLYAWLLVYEQETGNILTLEEVEEYLSREFEEDGTRRLYTDYENENIQGYIEFMEAMWGKTRAQTEARVLNPELPGPDGVPWEERSYATIDKRLRDIYSMLPEVVKENYWWTDLPLSIIEEMVKKVYDPEYEMQLEGLF